VTDDDRLCQRLYLKVSQKSAPADIQQ